MIRARLLISLLALLAFSGAAAAQFTVPDDLQTFWDRYSAAEAVDDEDEMDKLVGRYEQESKDTLSLMIDDLCKRDDTALHSMARTLAWSLDRVHRTERHIERVRLILDLEMAQRIQRRRAKDAFFDAVDAALQANKDRSQSQWDSATRELERLVAEFDSLGDTEAAIDCLSHLANVEAERRRKWERAVYLKQLVEKAADLPYRDPLAETCRLDLESLIASGIDPDKPKPAEAEGEGDGGGAAAEAGAGRTLTSYKAGSEEQTWELDVEIPKKGLVGFDLPTFYPPDQFQLWPVTYVGGNGPDDFDIQRPVPLKPHGRRWQAGRTGIAQFTLDVDNDGKADIEFSPSTTPSMIMVPHPDGGDDYPLWVSILSDRELMFSIETNYAPNQDGGRFRFGLGQYLEGKVEGQSIKVFDLNMDGKLGPAVENWDDLITEYSEDEHVLWFEPDGALIGRAKTGVPLSSVMQIGKGWYRMGFDATKNEITTRELDLATGFVQLDADLKVAPSHLVVREVSGKLEDAYFSVVPPKRGKPVELPVGTYQICFGFMTTGKKTSRDFVRIYQGSSEPFEVKPGETYDLEIGAPFKATFSTRQEGDERMLDTRTMRVFGRAGEEYARFFDEPLQPTVDVRGEDGHSIEKGSKMARAGIAEWQNDPEAHRVLWFPIRYMTPNPRNKALQFRIHQKAHPMLGGPIESDWIP